MVKLEGRISAKRLYGKINLVPSDGNSGGPLQAKTVYPSHSEQIIAPDDDYYGLVSVTVKPTPRLPACVASFAEGIHETVENVVNIAAVASVEAPKRITDFEWEVVPVDGAQYGFALNSAGYYESQNKGVDNSYAMCKIVFRTGESGYVVLNCINYAENNYDFGLISLADSMLTMDNSADDSAFSFKGKSDAQAQSACVRLPAGEHFVCVKFRKDSSSASGNDTFQFAIAE